MMEARDGINASTIIISRNNRQAPRGLRNDRLSCAISKIIHKQRNGPTDQDTLKEGSTMRTTKVLQDKKLNRRKLK